MIDPDIVAFAARHYGVSAEELKLSAVPLGGGLCATALRVRTRFLNPAHRPRTAAFVVKALSTCDVREIAAYHMVVNRFCVTQAPKLLGSQTLPDGSGRLYLEWVQPWRPWPWTDESLIARVVEALAVLHTSVSVQDFCARLSEWDYETELQRSAEDTLEYFELVLNDPQHHGLRRLLSPLRRVVASLPRLRRALLLEAVAVLHGDAHPGNIVVRLLGKRKQPVLLDWARVRLGSPLEDVNSWLHALGFWESIAHRRHDMLLRRYLAASGRSATLGSDFRDTYAAARASNALAGAMKYHLVNMTRAELPEETRRQAEAYVRDWGRNIVRAASCCRVGS
ncbi:MAG: phosphotransferase [Acidobacteriota bacterium]